MTRAAMSRDPTKVADAPTDHRCAPSSRASIGVHAQRRCCATNTHGGRRTLTVSRLHSRTSTQALLTQVTRNNEPFDAVVADLEMPKPFEAAQLSRRLEAMLREASARDEVVNAPRERKRLRVAMAVSAWIGLCRTTDRDGTRRVISGLGPMPDGPSVVAPPQRKSDLMASRCQLLATWCSLRPVERDRQGSPFSVRMTRTRGATSGRAHRKERPQDRAVVLVVDDDDDIREGVRTILEEAGYATLEASNGREALELLRHGEVTPGLLLLDLMMPMMDGWQLQSRLREDPVLASLPIVIMTAHAGMLRAVVSAQPAMPVLPKPLDIDQLLKVVATYCKEKPPHVQ